MDSDTRDIDSLLQALDAVRFTVTHAKKEVTIARVVFSLMFHLRPDGTNTIPDRMAAGAARVREDIGPENYLFWAAYDDTQVRMLTDEPVPPTNQLIAANRRDNRTVHRFLMADSQPNWAGDAPGFLLQFDHDEATDYWATHGGDVDAFSSTFQVSFPLPWLEARAEQGYPQQLFHDLCQALRPYHATGGLHLATSIERRYKQRNAAVLYPFLKRHPGIDNGNMTGRGAGMARDMSSVNWLTAVHDDLLDRCGGKDAVLAQLKTEGHAGGPMHDGWIFRAGPHPQLGDREEQVSLPHYGELARALKQARLDPDEHQYHPEGDWHQPDDEGGWEAAPAAYLTRLDGM